MSSLAQLADNLADPAPVYYALVSEINGIYNPDFLTPASTPDTRFVRVVTIMTELGQAHRLYWAQDSGHKDRFSIVIDHYSPDHADEVHELLTLLGIPKSENGSSRITLPTSMARDVQDNGGISITTRSVFDLLEILSGAVEIPEQDLVSGVAISFPPGGLVGKQLHVHHSETEPEHASVAVKYRNGWFYIDERDQATKQFFRLLTTLLSVNIADSTSRASATPVLTVPVSR